jgi:hypothetical protein
MSAPRDRLFVIDFLAAVIRNTDGYEAIRDEQPASLLYLSSGMPSEAIDC